MGIRNTIIRSLTKNITASDAVRAVGHSLRGAAMNAPPYVKAAGAVAGLGSAVYGGRALHSAYKAAKKWVNQEVDTPLGRGLCTEVQGYEDGCYILRVDVARSGSADTYLFRADQLTLVRELPEVPELTQPKKPQPRPQPRPQAEEPKAEVEEPKAEAEEPKAEAEEPKAEAEEPPPEARASRRKAEKADDVKDAS